MQIVYLNECYEKEEIIMKTYGISCTRVNYPFEKGRVIDIKGEPLYRGPKMKVKAYSMFIQDLEKNKCSSLVKIKDFEKIADVHEYSRCFGKYAPKVITFNIEDDISNIKNKLDTSNLQYPLFVRSDVESAAKYVGIDMCTLQSNSVSEINKVLDPIYKFIPNAGTIIMKEIIPVKKINGQTIEYRAIVINGRIICFDYESSNGLPCPESLPCIQQFEDCINVANHNGLNGAYFVDFGVDKNENIFVVECKNIINGTIKNISAFAEGLIKLGK